MREIYAPDTKAQAYSLKTEHPEARYIAGGTELLRLGSPYKSEGDLIDLSNLPLKGISIKGGKLVIGALSTFQEIAESPLSPLSLVESALFLGSRARRNAATVGGNIAAARDDSFLLPFFLAVGAEVQVIADSRETSIPISEYVKKHCDRALILSVAFDPSKPCLVKRISRTAQSHAALTIAVTEDSVGLAVKGGGLFTSLEDVVYTSELSGSAEYKEYIAGELYKELKEALNG